MAFINQMPRFEILAPGAVDAIERAWKRLASEIGIRFWHPEALDALAAAGQKIEGDVVRFDPDFVLEYVARTPAEFVLHSRDAAKTVRVGGDNMVFTCVGGPPFVREGGERRDGSLRDFTHFVQLTQYFDE